MLTRISLPEAGSRLSAGEIGVIPTDTIYGFVASALLPDSVERLYLVRGRNEKKPCIILLADLCDVERFGRRLSSEERQFLGTVWPGKVSVILPAFPNQFSYLHRGVGSLAFRVPSSPVLRGMLRVSGPVIAPSANPEGLKPAETIAEAEVYFGGLADFFVDAGSMKGSPSTLVRFDGKEVEVLRRGETRILEQPFMDRLT